jgi:uncharacterized protein YndB with AHSA1/START domain
MTTATRQSTLTTPSDREIVVERIFDAPRDRVWRAYTQPELVAQWWGRGNKLDVVRYEVERGGHWRFVEHTPNGSSHGFEGRFREVTPQDRLVYTFEWDGMPGHTALETVTFEAIGPTQTRMRAVALFFTNEERDGALGSGMEGGMNESYQALDRLLASMS